MGRPKKQGLDYFPVDTDIFDDFGIRILMSKFGADGFALYMYILTRIYRDKGYYIVADEDLELIASHDLGMSCEKVRQVLAYLYSRSLSLLPPEYRGGIRKLSRLGLQKMPSK